jgi:hypothetical protein
MATLRAALPSVFLWLAAAAAGCSNFRFDDYRRPDGGFEVSRLIEAHKAARASVLRELHWLPFISSRGTWFRSQNLRFASDRIGSSVPPPSLDYPPGYVVSEGGGLGPLAMIFWGTRKLVCDQEGKVYEKSETGGVLWRFWERERLWVETERGVREETRDGLLFGLLRLRPRVMHHPSWDAILPAP